MSANISASPTNRPQTAIRWALAGLGAVALALDLGHSHLEPGYARFTVFALPIWSAMVGFWLYFMPPAQELWSQKTVTRVGLLAVALALLDLIFIFVDRKA